MIPAKHGGRPRTSWNSSRRRKLVRLYSLTTLDKDEIRAVLKAHDFDPSSSDIQKKLRDLFPRDYAKDYQKFRPVDRRQMNTRLCSIRRRSRQTAGAILPTVSSQSDRLAVFEGPQTAFRTCPNQINDTISPSKITLSDGTLEILPLAPCILPLGKPEIQLEAMPLLNVDWLDSISGAEVVNPNALLLDGSSIDPCSIDTSDGICPTVPFDLSPHINPDKRSGFASGYSAMSICSLERRLGHHPRSLVRHVDGVLRCSLTNSWRSTVSSWFRSPSIQEESLPDVPAFPTPPDNVSIQRGPILARPSPPPQPNNVIGPIHTISEEISHCLEMESGLIWRENREYLFGPRTKPCCATNSDNTGKCLQCQSTRLHRQILAPCNSDSGIAVVQFVDLYLLNEVDKFGLTLLHCAGIACAAHDMALILHIISLGANTGSRNMYGQTFLHLLLGGMSSTKLRNIFPLLEDLFAAGFDFGARDFHGRTALLHFFACCTDICEQALPCIKRLVLYTGHQLGTMDNLGHSINYHMTEGSGKSIHQDHRSELLAAIPISENCHVHFWRAIEEFSFDWSAYGEWAAACGRSTWVDSYGDTAVSALLKSWRHGKDNELRIPSMLKKLVEAGADISMRDRHGDTALCIASVRGLRPAVTFLLNLGASIDTCNYEGESIMSKANAELHRAERKGDDKLYAMILSCIIILSDHEKKVT